MWQSKLLLILFMKIFPMNKFLFCCIIIFVSSAVQAQELQAKVNVMANRVYNTVDKKIFTTLQTSLTNFLNNRKWTNDIYKPAEKIQCNFLINIESVVETNVYKATLTVQSARPVYHSTYTSSLVNFQDGDLTFKYQEFQPIEFNENRVQGSDPLAANLSATLAYYVYIILGMDYDSFSPKAGEPYFQKAINIVNNAPEGKGISGWRNFDGLRNRYWLAENLNNNRYNIIHDVIYTYCRAGLDKQYSDPDESATNILQSLIQLQALNKENPNLMVVQFFLQSRSLELIQIFKNAKPDVKKRAKEVLSEIDVANASKYQEQIK